MTLSTLLIGKILRANLSPNNKNTKREGGSKGVMTGGGGVEGEERLKQCKAEPITDLEEKVYSTPDRREKSQQ